MSWEAIKAFVVYNAVPLAVLAGVFVVGLIIGAICL